MESTTTTATNGIFQIVPAAAYPATADPVIYVEIDGSPTVLIREGTTLEDAVAELNRTVTHLVRHGIWQLAGDGDTKPPSHLRHVS